MADTMNDTLPVVSVVEKKWVNFGNDGEEIVDKANVNENDTNQQNDKQNESSNINLPPPPRPKSRQKHNSSDSKHNSTDNKSTDHLHDNKPSRSSISPSSSNSRTNNQPADRQSRSTRLNIVDKSSDIHQSQDCTLNMPETFITTSPLNNLQNVPLRDTSTPTTHSTTISNTTNNSPRFKNGDILVTLLPLNLHCAWITPALFKAELVPEELMNPEFRLTVEDYVQAMSMLINDYRFNLYIIFYKKVALIWLTLSLCILFYLLFSNAEGVFMFFGMLIWILLNAFGYFLIQYMKIMMVRNLERCLARVNEHLYKNKILVGVEDKGKLSCHKINLIFMYFDGTECIKQLNGLFNRDGEMESINNTINNLNQLNNNNPNSVNLNKYTSNAPNQQQQQQSINILQQDIEISDIVITGTRPTRLTQKEKYGEKLFLRYSQRFIKDFMRGKVGFKVHLHYDSSVGLPANIQPRHCEKARCLCQYIEEHLSFKPYHKCGFSDIFG